MPPHQRTPPAGGVGAVGSQESLRINVRAAALTLMRMGPAAPTPPLETVPLNGYGRKFHSTIHPKYYSEYDFPTGLNLKERAIIALRICYSG
mgnify:CR=1 FL=1